MPNPVDALLLKRKLPVRDYVPAKKRRIGNRATVEGTAQIADAPPESVHVEKLKRNLRDLGYEVKLRLHSNPQNDNECGYRSIICSYVLGALERFNISPEKLPEAMWQTKDAIEFCNSVIEQEPRSVAICLSDVSLVKIAERIEFLYTNFYLYPWSFKNATTLNEILLKMKTFFEVPNYPESIIKDICEIRSKLKYTHLKYLLSEWEDKIMSNDIDYGKARESFESMFFPNGKMPAWFSGVYSFQNFLNHMRNLPEETQRDRSLNSKRSAIVNTASVLYSNEHWFVVTYENYKVKERMDRTRKATAN